MTDTLDAKLINLGYTLQPHLTRTLDDLDSSKVFVYTKGSIIIEINKNKIYFKSYAYLNDKYLITKNDLKELINSYNILQKDLIKLHKIQGGN